MASNATSLLTQGIIAQAVIAKNQPITKTGTVAAAGGTCIGFSQTSAAIGERFSVTVLGSGIGVAGGTIAVNAALQVGANGTVITQATGAIIGRAMNAAVLGDHVEVFIAPHGNVSSGENPVTGVVELTAGGEVMDVGGCKQVARPTSRHLRQCQQRVFHRVSMAARG